MVTVCFVPPHFGSSDLYWKSIQSTGLKPLSDLQVINVLLSEWHRRGYCWFQENVSTWYCVHIYQAVKIWFICPDIHEADFFDGLGKYEIVCEKMTEHRTLASFFSNMERAILVKHMASIDPYAFIKLCTCPERFFFLITTSGLSHHLSFFLTSSTAIKCLFLWLS